MNIFLRYAFWKSSVTMAFAVASVPHLLLIIAIGDPRSVRDEDGSQTSSQHVKVDTMSSVKLGRPTTMAEANAKENGGKHNHDLAKQPLEFLERFL